MNRSSSSSNRFEQVTDTVNWSFAMIAATARSSACEARRAGSLVSISRLPLKVQKSREASGRLRRWLQSNGSRAQGESQPEVRSPLKLRDRVPLLDCESFPIVEEGVDRIENDFDAVAGGGPHHRD